MRRVSLRRQKENRDRKKLIPNQAMCEARLLGCDHVASDWHEVRTRARGGSITDPENREWLCRHCHTWLTEHPDWALRHGHMVNSWSDDGALDRALLVRQLWKYCALTCERDHRA